MWLPIPIDRGMTPNLEGYDLPPGEVQYADGFINRERGYVSFGSGSDIALSVSGTVKTIREDVYNGRTFVLTSTLAYKGVSSPEDISKSGVTDYDADSGWDMCQYGTNNVFCPGTAASTGPQLYTGTGDCTDFISTMPTGVTAFKAAYCLYKFGFVLFGNCKEDSASHPQRVRWGNNVLTGTITSLLESVAGGADYRDIKEVDGDIVDMEHIGENILIAHQYGLSVMYLAQRAPYGFSYEPVVPKGRSIVRGSLVPFENGAFYLDRNSGIRYYGQGSDYLVKPLDRATSNTSNFSEGFHTPSLQTVGWHCDWVQGAPVSKMILWNYEKKALTVYYPTTYFASVSNYTPYYIITGASPAYGILTAATANLITSSTLITREITGRDLRGTAQDIVNIRGVRLLGATMTVTGVYIGYRDKPTDSITYTAAAAYNAVDGTYSIRASGRFLCVKVVATNAHISGIDVDIVRAGER
jgi:hypothetical protein